MKTLIPAIVITAVVAGGGGFFGGTKYSGSRDGKDAFRERTGDQFFIGSSDQRERMQRNGGGTRAGNGMAIGGFVVGEVLKKDGQSITVKMPDGSSRIVFYSETTKLTKTIDGSMTELETGMNVRVMGPSNQDGSVTAQNIQIVPAGTGTFPAGGDPRPLP